MGAGALIRDVEGRVLLVEPTYKDRWELPGGTVETDESPRAACRRELEEELGLQVEVGRMLVLEHQGPEPNRTESLMVVYDGGVVDPASIVLAADELASFAFVDVADLDGRLVPRLSRRLHAALRGLEQGRLVEMENGVELSVRCVSPARR